MRLARRVNLRFRRSVHIVSSASTPRFTARESPFPTVAPINLPQVIVSDLLVWKRRHEEESARAGTRWQEKGFVFTTTIGTPLEPLNVERAFVQILKLANPHSRPAPHGRDSAAGAGRSSARRNAVARAQPNRRHNEHLFPRRTDAPERRSKKVNAALEPPQDAVATSVAARCAPATLN